MIEFLENTLLTLFFVFIFIVCQYNIALTRIQNTLYLHVFLAIPTRKTKKCYNCVFCPKSSRVQNKAQTLSNTHTKPYILEVPPQYCLVLLGRISALRDQKNKGSRIVELIFTQLNWTHFDFPRAIKLKVPEQQSLFLRS